VWGGYSDKHGKELLTIAWRGYFGEEVFYKTCKIGYDIFNLTYHHYKGEKK